MVNPKANHESS